MRTRERTEQSTHRPEAIGQKDVGLTAGKRLYRQLQSSVEGKQNEYCRENYGFY